VGRDVPGSCEWEPGKARKIVARVKHPRRQVIFSVDIMVYKPSQLLRISSRLCLDCGASIEPERTTLTCAACVQKKALEDQARRRAPGWTWASATIAPSPSLQAKRGAHRALLSVRHSIVRIAPSGWPMVAACNVGRPTHCRLSPTNASRYAKHAGTVGLRGTIPVRACTGGCCATRSQPRTVAARTLAMG
jgi:hypothetical protein